MGVWPINVVKNISSIRKLCHKVRTPAKTFCTHGIKMIKNRLKMPNFAGAGTLTWIGRNAEEILNSCTNSKYNSPSGSRYTIWPCIMCVNKHLPSPSKHARTSISKFTASDWKMCQDGLRVNLVRLKQQKPYHSESNAEVIFTRR